MKNKKNVLYSLIILSAAGVSYSPAQAPQGKVVNPYDGASLVLDTKHKGAITMILFGRSKFRKVK